MVFECEPGEQGVEDGSLMAFRMNLSGKQVGIQHFYMCMGHSRTRQTSYLALCYCWIVAFKMMIPKHFVLVIRPPIAVTASLVPLSNFNVEHR